MGDVNNIQGQGDITIGGDVIGHDKITVTNIYQSPTPIAYNLHQLPSPPPDFTGRDVELSELLNVARKREVSYISLCGLGGIGKTTLALKLAENLIDDYPDAQFFLDLRGAGDNPLSITDALVHIIRAYYPNSPIPKNDDELSGLYRSVLNGKRALILFDNARDATQIQALIPPSTCFLVITSRQHFILPGLYVRKIEVLPRLTSIKLLEKITSKVADQANTISAWCGDLPLALRLVGSVLAERIDLHPIDLVKRLSKTDDLLSITGADASLALSYDLLIPELQKRWRQLATFPGSFDLAAVYSIWQIKEHVAQDILGMLIRYSLVEFNSRPSLPNLRKVKTLDGSPLPDNEEPEPVPIPKSRYYLHDLARAFANKQMTVRETFKVKKHHAKYYMELLHKYLAPLRPDQGRQGNNLIHRMLYQFALLDMELENITAGQAWSATNMSHDNEIALICSNYANLNSNREGRLNSYHLSTYLNNSHKESLGVRWFEDGIAASQILQDKRKELEILSILSSGYIMTKQSERVIATYYRQVELSHELEDYSFESNALINMSTHYEGEHDFVKASNCLKEAIQIAQRIGEGHTEGRASTHLSKMLYELEQWQESFEYAETACRLLDIEEDPDGRLAKHWLDKHRNELIEKIRTANQKRLVSHYQPVIDMIVAYCKGNKALQQQIEKSLDNIGSQADRTYLVDSLRRITFQGARIEKRLIDLLESKEEVAVIREILHQINR